VITKMSGEFWGMTAFFITTVIFSITTLIYSQKLSQAKQALRQQLKKESQSQPLDCERQCKK
jgi:hypothetical protein